MENNMFAPLGPGETPRIPQPPDDDWQPMPAPGTSPDFRHYEFGIPSRTWPYTNAAGELEGYVCRFETKTPDGPDKEFRPRRYGTLTKDGKARTGWHWKGWGDNRPLYGIGDLLARADAPVLVVEGEKKVDAARRLFPDYVAVSPMNGARSPHKTEWTPLARRVVVVWPDRDASGSVFAQEVVKLNAEAASVAIVAIPANFPEGWDLADAPPDGVGLEDLVAMLDAARSSESADPEISEDEANAKIWTLAQMSDLAYGRERNGAAKALGLSVSWLDKLRRQKTAEIRAASGESTTGPGQPLNYTEIEPWPEAVDGAALLDELTKQVSKYVILEAAAACAVALWVVFVHAFSVAYCAPKLLITSVMPRCGKTRLLQILLYLTPRPETTANIKPAALYRIIEKHRPTLLIDEGDTFLGNNDELRGIINSGFERETAWVTVTVPAGDGWDVRKFSTWCPQAIAGIGRMPDTITDRSFKIQIKRKLRDEKVEKLRRRNVGPLIDLGRKVTRWVVDHQQEIEQAVPELPEALNDRAADAWETCIAIADIAGGEWPGQARKAALTLSGDDAIVEDNNILTKLLGDIRAAFEDRGADMNESDYRGPRIASEELVSYLATLDESPWAEWGKARKPISKTQLSGLLRPLGISSETVKVAKNKTAKGYYRSKFNDAFARYLSPEKTDPQRSSPPKPGFETSPRHHPHEPSAFREKGSVTDAYRLPFENTENLSVSAADDAVTLRIPHPGPNAHFGSSAKPYESAEVNGKMRDRDLSEQNGADDTDGLPPAQSGPRNTHITSPRASGQVRGRL